MDKKEKGKMEKEDSIKKLEKEFGDFQKEWQKEWQKFRTNDFHHLVSKVDGLADSVAVFIARDVASDASIKALGKSIHVMDDNILEILRRMK